MADLESLVFGIRSLHVDTPSESNDSSNGDDDDDSGSDVGTVLGSTISSSDAAATVSSFMASSGIFSLSTTASLHEQKLALWQSLLVGFRLCAPTDASAASDSFWAGRPKHYPKIPPALPTSTTGCVALLKGYVHVNIKDMKEKGTDAKVHVSSNSLVRYTFKKKLFFPLKEAKGELLQPLLRSVLHQGHGVRA